MINGRILRPVAAGALLVGIAVLIVVVGALAFSWLNADNDEVQREESREVRSMPGSSEAITTQEVRDEEDTDDSGDRSTFSEPSVLCGSGGGGMSAGPPDSPESLAWISHEVVKGTVVEELGPRWGPESMSGPGVDEQFDGVPIRSISTEYVVTVEDRIRGNPDSEIRVGIEGGTIDDCTIDFHGAGLSPGEEVVLFLDERDVPDEYAAQVTDGRPVYRLVNSMLGIWVYSEQGTVTPKQLLEEADPSRENDAAALDHFTHDWSELRERLIVSLASGAAPEDEYRPTEVVPLEDAPLQAEHQ